MKALLLTIYPYSRIYMLFNPLFLYIVH